MTLTPAYGKDYKSKAEVTKAFNDDSDFVVNDIMSQWDGSYVNRSQLVTAGVTQCNIRYKKLGTVLVMDVTKGKPR